ncbi:MAG: amidohydrolase family protein, partial [Idiomarina sp.]|nr:amidohydrolase family protein [Idiomarina sp.]
MKKVHQLSALTLAVTSVLTTSVAADQTSRTNGMRDNTPSLTAIQNATIITEPGKSVSNATLVIENGTVQSIERNNRAPAGARVIDGTGYTIYPGFIDPYSSYGIQASAEQERSETPIYNNEREGGNAANDAIHSQKRWFSEFKTNSEDANKWVSQGFTSVQSANLDGIFQGQAVTVSLADKIPNDVVYQSTAKHFGSFDKGSSQQQYPSSLMGSIALVRQTLSDANWYENSYGKQAHNQPVEFNAALDSLTTIESQGIVFKVSDEKSLLRADDVFDQFNVPSVYVGSGYEYARLDAVKNAESDLILPLNFPAAPEVAGVDGHLDVDLAKLRHWERAPSNPAMLANAGVNFALTLHDLEKSESFWPNLRKAVKHGLSEEQALAALTTTPAKIAGIEDKAGKLAQGYMADFVMVKGDLFADGTIQSVWLQGEENELVSRDEVDFVGNYRIDWNDREVEIAIKPGAVLAGEIKLGEQSNALRNVQSSPESLSFVADLELEPAGSWRFKLEPEAQDAFSVTAVSPEGDEITLQAQMDAAESATEETKEADSVEYVSELTFPNVAYGLDGLPERQD